MSRFLVFFALLFSILTLPATSDDRSSDKEHGSGKTLTPRIESISPASAFEDQRVTITGSDFDSRGLHVTVGGLPADILNADSHTVTFRVPERAIPGATEVIVKNSSGNTASIAFTVLEHVSPAVACIQGKDKNHSLFGDLDEKEWHPDGDRDDKLIRCLSPIAARRGEPVIVWLRGFEGSNLRLTLNNLPLTITRAHGESLSFIVPQGATTGDVVISVTRKGETSGMKFTVLDGSLLPGSPDAKALDVLVDQPPVAIGGDSLDNGLVLTQLELAIDPAATVAQVNAALQKVEGGVVSSAKGLTQFTIAVPRQASVPDLEDLTQVLLAQPGIAFAGVGTVAQPKRIFTDATLDNVVQIRHLLPGRFPAAWNVAKRLMNGPDLSAPCTVSPIPLLVADYFDSTPPSIFTSSIPNFKPAAHAPPGAISAKAQGHGYAVTLVAGAQGIGADPITNCLDIRLVQIAGFLPYGNIDSIVHNMLPKGTKFIVNYSAGFPDDCAASPCQPPSDRMPSAATRAWDALYWKKQTKDRWPDFLMVVAAGNERTEESTTIYPGMGDSRYGSQMAIAQLPDPLMQWAADPGLWTPNANFAAQGFTSLALGTTNQSQLAQDISNAGLTNADSTADNVIVVGSVVSPSRSSVLTQRVGPEQLSESVFSDSNPDVLAVGEDIFDQPVIAGTSFAAPAVSGLAAYLWALDPNLESQGPAITKQAIVANARNKVIDAYATVLSLDAAATPAPSNAPMRMALLDVNGDGGFNENDILEFLQHLYFVDPNTGTITFNSPANTNADFSKYDLNGDGFTTSGSRRERFDLDRVGSTQYGAAKYSTVTQNIEGNDVRFDESGLTDVEILCYYSYSPLYQGDPDARKSLLAGRCGLSVQPPTATVNTGQQQQFTAVTPTNDSVTWSVTPGCGTIDQTGAFSATTPGTCTVHATDNNTSLTGQATVTVRSSSGLFTGTLTYAVDNVEDSQELFQGNLVNFHFEDHQRVSAFVTAGVLANGNITIISASGTETDRSTANQGECFRQSDGVEVLVGEHDFNQDETIGAGRFANISSSFGFLTFQASGTQSETVFDANCANPTTVPTAIPLQDLNSILGGPANLIGTSVFQNGQLVSVDFNKVEDESSAGVSRVITTTGQLVKQP